MTAFSFMDLSIVITTFNYKQYILECIDSCLDQKPHHLQYEIIVVDDGSTDDTPNILSKLTSKRLRVFRINNSGIEKASNYGFSRAIGKYLVRLDADDLLTPIFCQVAEKILHSRHGFYYSDYNVIDSKSHVLSQMRLPKFCMDEIVSRGDFLATGTIYDADLIRQVGGYSTRRVNSGLENYELVLELLDRGVQGFHIPIPLFCYRRHSLNLSEIKTQQIIENGKILFEERKLGRFRSNQYHPYGLEV